MVGSASSGPATEIAVRSWLQVKASDTRKENKKKKKKKKKKLLHFFWGGEGWHGDCRVGLGALFGINGSAKSNFSFIPTPV